LKSKTSQVMINKIYTLFKASDRPFIPTNLGRLLEQGRLEPNGRVSQYWNSQVKRSPNSIAVNSTPMYERSVSNDTNSLVGLRRKGRQAVSRDE